MHAQFERGVADSLARLKRTAERPRGAA